MNRRTDRLRPIFIVGPEGCGKSTYIQNLARKEGRELIRCPCRKDRTLREQRARIHELAMRAEPILIWLEGSDDLTPEAQSFLRRILETYAASVRFCLEGRSVESIQEPILSRCDIMRIEAPATVSTDSDIRDVLERTDRLSYRKVKALESVRGLFPDVWEQMKRYRPSQPAATLSQMIENAENPWTAIWSEFESLDADTQQTVLTTGMHHGNGWAALALSKTVPRVNTA